MSASEHPEPAAALPGSGPGTVVVLLAYGSPRSEDELRDFLTSVREGVPPRDREVRYLAARYEEAEWPAAGVDATEAVRARLQKTLGVPCACAFRHAHPRMAETVARLEDDGVTDALVTTLVPLPGHFSSDAYAQLLAQALTEADVPLECRFVHGWWQDERLTGALGRSLKETLANVIDERPEVIFTAHSLPLDGLPDDDPYVPAYEEMAARVAAAAGLQEGGWSLSYQSAPIPAGWLQPSIGQAMAEAAAGGAGTVVVMPLGFLFDNLEVTWGLDVEAREFASQLGLGYLRVPLLNDDPALVETLAGFLAPHLAAT